MGGGTFVSVCTFLWARLIDLHGPSFSDLTGRDPCRVGDVEWSKGVRGRVITMVRGPHYHTQIGRAACRERV